MKSLPSPVCIRYGENNFGMQSASKPVKCITWLFLKDNYRRCVKRSPQRLFQRAVRHHVRAARNRTPFIGQASLSIHPWRLREAVIARVPGRSLKA
ncbi:hypothetical protein PSP6_210343 [Paraburkholderia tropica]|nr:hypothetical protein PSP6_210343 [Paraburkholderia tropica]